MLPDLYVVKDTVQSFPSGSAVAPIWTIGERGPILPPFGTKQRDYALRSFARHDFNGIWPGAVSGIKKRIASAQVIFEGDSPYIEYYQRLWQQAHFSQGPSIFLKRGIADFLEQDYGWFIEIIGDGPPDTPLEGPVRGIAHLDAGRCYVTGNPTYPVLYYSLWSGSLHKLHATRVYRIVDNPSPDERFYGIGTCALSRGIAAVQREIRMAQYVDLTLDDRPPPGLMLVNNISDKQWEAAIQKYGNQFMSDQMDHFGRTMILKNLDPQKEASVQTVTFATPPEKFDFVSYSEFDIDVIANALNIDRQEIAELKGRSLGSGAQSEVLAEKSNGKTIGDIFSSIERFMNLVVLPPDINMSFKSEDPKADERRAALNNSYAQTAVSVVSDGILNVQESRKLLAKQSPDFADVLINDQGQLATGLSATPTEQVPQVEVPAQLPSQAQQVNDSETISKSLHVIEKAYSATREAWIFKFANTLSRYILHNLDRSLAETMLLSALESEARQAFIDGLSEGGVDEMDDADNAVLDRFLVEQIDFIDGLFSQIDAGTLMLADVPTRANAWANKSLYPMYLSGQESANSNGYYVWKVGPTEKSCEDCQRLNGQVHRLRDWTRKGYAPKSDTLKCGGFQCQCTLTRADGPAQGDY